MRRLGCILLVCLLCLGAAASAEEMEAMLRASDALYVALAQLLPGVPETRFAQSGRWMSAIGSATDVDGTHLAGAIYDLDGDALVTWEDLFADGDAAAERIAALAEASVYDNAYAERNAIRPVPRDSFAIEGNQLIVYYPAAQLAHFSGRAGAFAFYAYELEGLLREEAPLAGGNVMEAAQAMADALATGTLPGVAPALGDAMRPVADSAGLVDVPDMKYDAAVWHFEGPELRGVSLLSAPDDSDEGTAVIRGILAGRLDFSGLCVGKATRDTCVAALGEPDAVERVEGADAYSLLPDGETLLWRGQGNLFALHFVGDVLQSVLLRAEG